MARKRKVQNSFGGNVDTSVHVAPYENPISDESTFGNMNGNQPAGGYQQQPPDTQVNTGTGIPNPEFDLRNEVQDLRTGGFFQGGNILGNLDPQLQQSIQGNILDLTTGQAGAAQRAAANEANIRNAANARARTADTGTLGQGASIQAQQGVEQDIRAGTSDAIIQQNMADQKLRQQGTLLGLNLAQQNEQSKQFAKNLELAFMGMAGDQQNLLTKLTVDQQNLLTKLDFDKAINSENLATQLEMLGMSITSKEKLETDKNWLIQQGIDFEKAKWEGYEDENGNWVMGTQQLEMIQHTALMNSQAGQSFASYVQGNLNADLSDPALRNLGNELWKALGNDGEAPDWWINARIEAVKDPRLTNPIIGTIAFMEEALASGKLGPNGQEVFDNFLNGFINDLTGTGSGTTTDPEIKNIDTFNTFSERIPTTPEGDAVTQEYWELAGKPKTWEEFQAADILGDIDIIDENGDIVTKNLNKVHDAIKMGNTQATKKFKMDSEIESTLEHLWANKKQVAGPEAESLKRELEKSIGKIFYFPGSNARPKGDYVIRKVFEKEELVTGIQIPGNEKYYRTIIEVMNVKTNKIEEIYAPIEWG